MPKSTGKNYGSTKKRAKVPPSAGSGSREKTVTRRRHQDGQLIETEHGWSVRYRIQGEGKRKRVQKFLGTFAQLTRPMAKTEMAKVLLDVNEHPVCEPQTTTQTFAEYAEQWIAKCQTRKKKPVKASVLHGWRVILNRHLLDFLGPIPLADVDSVKLGELVEHLSTKVSKISGNPLKAATIQNILLVAKLVKRSARAVGKDGKPGKRLFTEAWDSELIDAPEVKKKKQHRPCFTEKEVTAIVSAATGRLQMVCILAAATGLRIGEVLGLDCKDFDGTAVTVNRAIWNGKPYDPKTENALRTVDLAPNVAELLQQFIGNRKKGYIFQVASGKPLGQSNLLRRELKPLLKQLGIERKGFHSFRRFRNTYLRNDVRCPAGLLKLWMGHAPEDETDTYDRVEENVPFCQSEADRCGVGFELPKTLTAKKSNQEKPTLLGVNVQLVSEEAR
jgi:integrase